MPYKSITNQFLELVDLGEKIIRDTRSANEQIRVEPAKKEEIIKKINDSLTAWRTSCGKFLTENELHLEYQEFISYSGSAWARSNFNIKLNGLLNYTEDRKRLLIKFAKDIEKKANVDSQIVQADKKEEILKLKPELYGLSINLKALWRGIKAFIKKIVMKIKPR